MNFILIKGKKEDENGRIKLLQVVALLQKLTHKIRVYQQLKRHKTIPTETKQGTAKHPRNFF